MPTYDFVCNTCNQRFDIFMTFNEYGIKKVFCTHCNSEDVRRRMTKVRIAKSDESRAQKLAEDFTGFENLESDPQALGHMMRKMGGEMGEDLPPEFDEVVDRLESGQSAEDIESALPDLGKDTASNDE